MAKHVLVVLTNPVTGMDDEYNSWYNDTHLEDVVGLEGFTSAKRFRFESAHGSSENPTQSYLALYEVEENQYENARAALEQAIAESNAAVEAGEKPGMYISPALGSDRNAWWFTEIAQHPGDSHG